MSEQPDGQAVTRLAEEFIKAVVMRDLAEGITGDYIDKDDVETGLRALLASGFVITREDHEQALGRALDGWRDEESEHERLKKKVLELADKWTEAGTDCACCGAYTHCTRQLRRLIEEA